MFEIRLLHESDAEYQELIQKKGSYYDQYCREWDTLSESEKQLCTHPMYMADYLKAVRSYRKERFFIAAILKESVCVSLIPMTVRFLFSKRFRIYYLEVMTVASGSSIAISEQYYGNVFRELHNQKYDGLTKPLFINFQSVEDSHALVRSDVQSIVAKSDATRYSLNIADNEYRKSSFFRNLERLHRKLSMLGDLRVEYVCRTDEVTAAYEEFAVLEARGWKKKTKTYIMGNDFIRTFSSSIFSDFSIDDRTVISRLTLDDKTISMTMGIIIDNRYYYLFTVYDEEYSKFSVGHILLYLMAGDYLPSRDVQSIETLSSSKWFSLWKPRERSKYSVFVFRNALGKWLAYPAIFALKRCRLPMPGKSARYKSGYTSRPEVMKKY